MQVMKKYWRMDHRSIKRWSKWCWEGWARKIRRAKNDEWVIKYIAIKNREIIQGVGPMLIKLTILQF